MQPIPALTPGQLRRVCDQGVLEFEDTSTLAGPVGMIGQRRAVAAFEFGLDVASPGYNIFMAGLTGTGKTTYARTYLEERSRREPVPGDWCYLYNFATPDCPIAVELEPGTGPALARAMDELVSDLERELPQAFASDEYQRRRNALTQRYQELSSNLLGDLERRLGAAGFTLARIGSGLATMPVVDGKPLSPEDAAGLPPERREELESASRRAQALAGGVMRRLGELERGLKTELLALEKDIGRLAVAPRIAELTRAYAANPRIVGYLEQVQGDILERLDLFREGREQRPEPAPPFGPLNRYRVNVVVHNGKTEGAPVVSETNPTRANLCGGIEYRGHMGLLMTDFTQIKPGALHRANGGYLLLNAADVLRDPQAWAGLKRALRNQEVRVEGPGLSSGPLVSTGIQPEPIPLKVKVILIGHPLLYQLLYGNDEEFRKLFKVKAEFDSSMPRTPENVMQYARFVAAVCRRDGLRHFERAAVAKLVEYGSRLVGDQERLSTRFNDVVEVIHEANAHAARAGAGLVGAAQVRLALEEKAYRSNLWEEKVQDQIARGVTLVSTTGTVVGQVNGVAVYDLGDYAFGKPTRITARTFAGEAGVVNIERETALSGKLHSKGVLILQGYLGGKYARHRPLGLHASVAFEQVYEEVEGDSAASAELYALLSSLAGLPIRQGVAVTGSVNQHGEVQPVGGVNQKIEGFFTTCRAQGLTGEQGVVIPVQNVQHLMLCEDVVEAVTRGEFHVWAVSAVDEGLEVLTGVEAGQAGPDGSYPPESVHGLVQARLDVLADAVRAYRR